jgi:peptidoglycan/xylan/chitin deacetylase (PgdA/CDA1 family)
MKCAILTYHSHHVVGPAYEVNDHVALAIDLDIICRAGYRVVPLSKIVALIEEGASQRGGWPTTDERLVGITFDDGPCFDVEDFAHPDLGVQRGFLGIMRDFLDSPNGDRQPDLHATSFVIASPAARKRMESTFDAQYTYLLPGSLGDAWWRDASATGLLGIANHSWDHLHPKLDVVAHSRQARGDFTQVDNSLDADAQIERAAEYIHAATGGRSSPYFAYPFGHCNDFLAQDYFPSRARHAVSAAFTAEPRHLAKGQSVWTIPRYTCGHHWKSPDELFRILSQDEAADCSAREQ